MKKIILAASLFVATVASAQLKTPQPSPTASIKQVVGLTDVEVTYSRPGVKDRTIFGDLVPFGEVWRVGANASTKINISDDVKIGGKDVAAGEYALYAIPGETEWTIIIHKNTTLWGSGGYKQEDDLVRFTAKPRKLNDAVESFTIDFSDFTSNTANINLNWANTNVTFPIETGANEAVAAQINELLVEGPSAGTYYGAVRYYLDNNKDMNQALKWINIAIEKRPEAFWYVHQKANVQAKLGDKKGAIVTATKSMTIAKASKEGDYGYIAKNEKLIKELKIK